MTKKRDVKREDIANKISKNTIVSNVILSIIKVVIGIISRSSALLADGVHSLSDIVSTVAVMIGVKISSRPEDESHPYGHEKVEPIIAKILATILFLTALGIGYNAINIIIKGEYIIPGQIAIIGAAISIGAKEWMYRYTVKGAKEINSSALLADAWHHRSDAFSSIAALIGVIGARLGFSIFDPLASILVCIVIVKVSIEIYIQGINQVIDKSADEETLEDIRGNIMGVNGVKEIDDLKTRIHGNKLFVDVEIAVESSLSVKEGHEIAEEVHQMIERLDETIKHCMVHVNPYYISDTKN